MLTAALAVHWAAGVSAETASSKTTTSSSTNAKSNTTSNTSAPAQRINNIVNYNTVKVNQNPGPVNRITPSGTQAMTPNAQSKYGGGLRTNPVPSPTSTNPNARYNSQGRNVNPTGDKKIAAGFDANQKRYQANQSKPATTPSTTRSWPGPTRPTTTPTVQRSTTTASAVSRPNPPPPPRTDSTSSSSSTATSNSNKKP
jgi:hypothetical protein